MSGRGRHYHSAGPWRCDLIRLAGAAAPAARPSDAEIAALLTARYPPAVWTRRQVGYYRRLLLADPELGTARAARATRDLVYQGHRGWGHLAPAYDEEARLWLPGHELTRREVDILCVLRDKGPLSRRALGKALGLPPANPLRSGNVSLLARMTAAGLLTVTAGRPPVYALAVAPRRQRDTMLEFLRAFGTLDNT